VGYESRVVVMQQHLNKIFEVSDHIRYVAIYRNGKLISRVRPNIAHASDSASDKYEELLVNPTILTLVSQRGNIDCGGSRFVVVRYGNFFQFMMRIDGGHVSVCIDPEADVLTLSQQLYESILSSTTIQAAAAIAL